MVDTHTTAYPVAVVVFILVFGNDKRLALVVFFTDTKAVFVLILRDGNGLSVHCRDCLYQLAALVILIACTVFL